MENLTLSIMGRDYRLACEPGEKDTLLACADYVEKRMTSIRDGGKIMGADRIAVMAALQIAHELLTVKGSDGADLGEFRQRIRTLSQICDQVLVPQEKLF